MKPLNDYRHIRGVCYSYLGDEERMRRELGYGARVGLNSIRFWTSAVRYETEGDAYIQSIKRKVQIAYDCGYTSMPILFNGNGMTNDDEPKTLSLEYRKVQEEFCEKMIDALKDESCGMLRQQLGGIKALYIRPIVYSLKGLSYVRIVCRHIILQKSKLYKVGLHVTGNVDYRFYFSVFGGVSEAECPLPVKLVFVHTFQILSIIGSYKL